MKKINVAIMGLGTVGGGTYEILTENRELIASTHGVDVEVVKILDKSVDRITMRGLPVSLAVTDLDEILKDKSISIVVETMGGVEPAKTFITKALLAGKSVVTANKELLSKHWPELEKAAKKGKAGLYFEASCVGGVPIIRTLTESMQANRLSELMGIINGTTNYILTKMTEDGMSYDAALKEAQALGYAEFNPTADVDGYDAMYKLSILSSLAFNTCIPYNEIYREGITGITQRDIRIGKDMGYTLKLLAIGRRAGNKVEARVHPTFVPNDHPLASVRGAFNAVFLKGDFVDDIMLYGRGAGARPTGSAIVSDIIYCALRETPLYTSFENNGKVAQDMEIAPDFSSKYYLALSALDKPGILAQITGILGKHGISISKMQQDESDDEFAEIILLTHHTKEKSVQAAVEELKSLSGVIKINGLIRVI